MYKFLQGGGEMGAIFRITDWAKTSLGTPDIWPDSLKTAVSISLNSGFPIAIYWGQDHTLLYNDAYRPIAGGKHPWALGKPGAVAWSEIWDALDEQFKAVINKGESVRSPDALLWMNRFGYTEECYFDYSLSPISDADGKVGGVFNAVVETTYKVITERRNQLIQKLLQNLNTRHSYEQSIRTSINIIADAREDVPFCLLYTTLADSQQQPALSAQGGTPVKIIADWPWQQAADQGKTYLINNLNEYLAEPANTLWDASCQEALIAPITQGKTKVTGYMIMGVSPRKKLDNEYQHFLESAALHTGTILNNAYAYEQDLIMTQRLQQSETRMRQALESEQILNEELLASNEELNQSQESLQNINMQLQHSEKLLDEVLNQIPTPVVVLSGHNQVIRLANQSILNFWNKSRQQVTGKPMLDVFPELKDQPFPAQWKHVFETGESIINREKPVVFNMPSGEARHSFVDYYYKAMTDVNGNRTAVLATVLDVTDKVEAREIIRKSEAEQQALNEELSAVNEEMLAANEELLTTNEELTEAQEILRQTLDQLNEKIKEQAISKKKIANSEERLKNMVMTTPIGMTLLRGRNLVIDIANERMLNIWSRTRNEVEGIPLLSVFPELIDQPFPELLMRVFDTGQPAAFPEMVANISTAEGSKQIFVDFSYDPLFDLDGKVEAIIVTVIDITEIVEARKSLEKSQLEQQLLNDELTAINEEMTASNEELLATNEELAEAQVNLRDMIEDLAESEARFRYIIQQAPVAIAILTGPDLVVESVNDKMLGIFGKTSDIISKNLADALPELDGQPFVSLLKNVYKTGIPYTLNEAKAWLEHNGELKEGYYNSIYHPLKDDYGNTTSIVIVANEVTEQVTARLELQKTEEMLRLSIQAANVGTWFMDVSSKAFVASSRLKELYGFNPDDNFTYETAIAQVPDENREQLNQAISNSLENGADYNMEYPVIGFHDQKKRWLRGLGKVYRDSEGMLSHFSGMVLDITEQKLDDIRKNDFIGMVSHELKTPLTSLSAYVQMLHSKAKKSEDNFTAGALEKAGLQVKRMSNMINGFLNVSRLESGKIMIDKQDFDLQQLLTETVDEIRITATNHHFNVLACNTLTITADREKIGSVISNLLSNAVKYSPKGQNIEIECQLIGDTVQVSVKDEGMGIKEKDIAKLFDRYYRVESNHTQHISGFGIGLYLSAEIIRRHNGKIWVESESGKGSIFYFTLPIRY